MSVEEITVAIAALSAPERRRLYVEIEQQKADDPAAPREAERGNLSAHDRAKGLIDTGSGRGDLSTNPAYMEGFGEEVRP